MRSNEGLGSMIPRAGYVVSPGHQAQTMRPLRVMTYNVRYFGHGTRGLASTKRSMHGIANAIAQLDPLPDIVCLQEVETASVRANLAHWRQSPDDTQLSRLMRVLHEALAAAGK